MKEVYGVLDVVLDNHSLSVALDEFRCRTGELIGQQESRLFMAQIGSNQLTNAAFVISKGDPAL